MLLPRPSLCGLVAGCIAVEPRSKTLSHKPSVKAKSRARDKSHPGRKMGTKWVQFGLISMIFGQDCVVFCEDSESGLQIAPKGRKRVKKIKTLSPSCWWAPIFGRASHDAHGVPSPTPDSDPSHRAVTFPI